jgi:hypothetical protein
MSIEEIPDLDFKKDLEVDKYNLDVELNNQSILFSKWAERCVDVENKRDRLKTQMELKQAKLDFEIRKNPTGYGLSEKPTEKAIRSCILRDTHYLELQESYQKMKYAASILKVAVKRFKDRERIIDRLIKLYLAKYYTEPTVRPEKEDEENKETNRAQATLGAHMKFSRVKRKS